MKAKKIFTLVGVAALALVSGGSASAIELGLDQTVTDGRQIYLLLHRDIENLEDPACLRKQTSFDAAERDAFLLAGCRLSSLYARKTAAFTLDGKPYIEILLKTECPNEKAWGTVSLTATCAGK